MNKRKASSPKESNQKSLRELSPDLDVSNITFGSALSSNVSFASLSSSSSSEEDKTTKSNIFEPTIVDTTMTDICVQVVRIKITQRNGEKFVGILDRNQGVEIWTKALKFNGDLLFGIALVSSGDRPFMFEYRLKSKLDADTIPKQFNHKLDGIEYTGVLVTSEGHAELGELVKIRIKNSRWRYPLHLVSQWISLFGVVAVEPAYVKASEVKELDLKSDDIVCEARLRKHMPNLLPAFGYRMKVLYPGQPVQCGKCMMYGHFRGDCNAEQLDWLYYSKVVMEECRVPKELMGKWVDLIENKFNQKP